MTGPTPAGTSSTGASITGRLVAALTAAWTAIQSRHPDVPDVVLTLGSGTLGARRGEVRWGHFAAGRWHTTDEPLELAGLAEAITAYRRAEVTTAGGTTSRNNPPATCGRPPCRPPPRP